MPELDEQILAGETEGKFPGSWPKVRTRADRRLAPAIASAASRSSRRRVTRPGTSRTWTRAIAR